MKYDRSALKSRGIYAIVNNVTGRVYIGKTIETFKKRWTTHRHELDRGVHCNVELQQDWYELGAAAFDFVIIHGFPDLPRYGYDFSMTALERQTIRTAECWLYNSADPGFDPKDEELIRWLYTRPYG